MIERITGRVERQGVDWVVVGLGAVSVRINTTSTTLAHLHDVEREVSLLTHLYIRDDVMTLYGFATHEERDLFERLIGVSGVGPRAAQMMLSTLSAAALHDAIDNERIDDLIRVPGIGRKTAQRVILELKGKLVPLGPRTTVQPATADHDLMSALVGLGYSTAEAAEALRRVPMQEGLSDEDRLRAALRHFAAAGG